MRTTRLQFKKAWREAINMSLGSISIWLFLFYTVWDFIHVLIYSPSYHFEAVLSQVFGKLLIFLYKSIGVLCDEKTFLYCEWITESRISSVWLVNKSFRLLWFKRFIVKINFNRMIHLQFINSSNFNLVYNCVPK